MSQEILTYLKKTRKNFAVVILLNIMNSFLTFLYIPFINGVEIKLFSNTDTIQNSLFVFAAVFMLITISVYFISKEKSNRYFINMTKEIKCNLGERLWSIDPSEINKYGESKYLMLVNKSDSCGTLVDNYLNIGISVVMLMSLCLYLIIKMDIRYLLFVILMLCIPIGTLILSNPITKKQQILNEKEKESFLLIKNMIKGLAVIKSYFLEKKMLYNFKKEIAFISDLEREKKVQQSVIEIYQQIGRCFIMILIPAITALLSKKINLMQGGILSSSIIFFYLLGNMMEISGRIEEVQEQKADIDFLNQYYNLPKLSTSYRKQIYKLYDLVGENLSYSYTEEKIFDGYNFRLPVKGLILIKGESGKGKSTLLKCISGLYPIKEGKISMGNRTMKREDLFCLCTYEPQEPVLCNVIEENFKIINERKDNYQISTILNEIDKKLCRRMEENVPSDMLSGGEKKILQILRGVLSEANWIFLDEPFSALELKKREVMKKVILEKSQKKCIVIATHEIDLDDCANDIWVLK